MMHSTDLSRVQAMEAAGQSLDVVLDGLVRNVGLLLDVPSCSVALLDPQTGDLVTSAALNAGPDGPRRTRFGPNEGVAGWVAGHLRPLRVDDVSSEPRFKRLGDERVGSLLCVPLMDDDQLLGTLTATSPLPRAFDARREQLLQVFAAQAVLAITKARQAETAQAQAKELAALLDAARALTSSLDTRQFFDALVSSIRRVVTCEDAVIYACDTHSRVLRVVAGLGKRVERLGGARISLDDADSIAARVAYERRPRMVPAGPATTGVVTETFLAGDPLALLSVPLVSKERLRGVITLAREFNFTQAEMATTLNLANIVAAALENVELYQTARTEREQQAAIFAAGSDGIAIVDDSLRIQEANEAFARLVGVSLSQLAGRRCCDALARRGAEAGCGLCNGRDCQVAAALESGRALPHLECELRAPAAAASSRPTGAPLPEVRPRGRPSPAMMPAHSVRYVDMSITPVQGPQGGRALLIGRDVTAVRQMDQMKANFLSMVAHELRSPLHTINGYLDVLLSGMSGALSPEQFEFMRRARAGSEHLKALVDDVLLMSRRDAGAFHLNKELVRLDQVMDEARDEVELMAADAGITLTCQRQPGLPIVEADGPRLQQVLRNLLSNAIKFTPKGGTVALVATYDDHWVRLSVSDSGIGIASEHLPLIFDRFYQVQSANGRSRGQGLGLAIVRMIVEKHGGIVEVRSKPGRGTVFTVAVPRSTVERGGPSDDL
jgi:signal transduction histidine kinase/GAF domain-containing protein